jgi:hypothetical protein
MEDANGKGVEIVGVWGHSRVGVSVGRELWYAQQIPAFTRK